MEGNAFFSVGTGLHPLLLNKHKMRLDAYPHCAVAQESLAGRESLGTRPWVQMGFAHSPFLCPFCRCPARVQSAASFWRLKRNATSAWQRSLWIIRPQVRDHPPLSVACRLTSLASHLPYHCHFSPLLLQEQGSDWILSSWCWVLMLVYKEKKVFPKHNPINQVFEKLDEGHPQSPSWVSPATVVSSHTSSKIASVLGAEQKKEGCAPWLKGDSEVWPSSCRSSPHSHARSWFCV